jgi:hypothetical protein
MPSFVSASTLAGHVEAYRWLGTAVSSRALTMADARRSVQHSIR